MDKSKRLFLTPEEALLMLPESKRCREMRQNATGFYGIDSNRELCTAIIQNAMIVEVSGKTMREMGYGIATYDGKTNVYIKHSEGILTAFESAMSDEEQQKRIEDSKKPGTAFSVEPKVEVSTHA